MKIKDGAIAKYAYFNIMDFKFCIALYIYFFAISLQNLYLCHSIVLWKLCLIQILTSINVCTYSKTKLRHQSKGENKAFKTALELPQTTGKIHMSMLCVYMELGGTQVRRV